MKLFQIYIIIDELFKEVTNLLLSIENNYTEFWYECENKVDELIITAVGCKS